MMRDSKPKPPPLIVKPPVLDFGTVRPGTRSERPLRIDHAEGAGGAGRVYLEEARTGLSLSATRFDSTPTTLIVTLDSTGYAGAARLETGIRIHSDDWDTHVRVRFRVRVFPRALRRGLSAAAVLLLGMAIWWAGGQRMAERAWSNRELPQLIATPPWVAERSSPMPPSLSGAEVARESRPAATQPQAQPSPPRSEVRQQPPATNPVPSSPSLREREPAIARARVPSPPPVQTPPIQPSAPRSGIAQQPPPTNPVPSSPPLRAREPVTARPQVPSPPPVQPPLRQKPDDLARIRRLRDDGRLSEALRAADEGLAAKPGAAELKTIRAELLGRIHEAALGASERVRTQRALTLLGFDTKGIDGDFGPNTRRAIRQFQQRQRAPETGWLTDDQRSILMTEGKPLLSDWEKRRPLQEPPSQGAVQNQPSRRVAPSQASSRTALAAGQVECVGPRGTFVVDAVSCRRAGGQPKT